MVHTERCAVCPSASLSWCLCSQRNSIIQYRKEWYLQACHLCSVWHAKAEYTSMVKQCICRYLYLWIYLVPVVLMSWGRKYSASLEMAKQKFSYCFKPLSINCPDSIRVLDALLGKCLQMLVGFWMFFGVLFCVVLLCFSTDYVPASKKAKEMEGKVKLGQPNFSLIFRNFCNGLDYCLLEYIKKDKHWLN